MKFFHSIVVFILITGYNCYAQQLQVTYKLEKTNDFKADHIKKDLPSIDQSVIDALEDNSKVTFLYILQHCNGNTLYKPSEKIDDEIKIVGGKHTIRRNNSSANNEYYRNYNTQLHLQQRHTPVKLLLLEDSLERPNWEILREQRIIGNFKCQKASMYDPYHKKTITAWFTSDIPIEEGPEYFWGLPGLIIYVERGNERILATSIKHSADCKTIAPPSKGQKIAGNDYRSLSKESLLIPIGTSKN